MEDLLVTRAEIVIGESPGNSVVEESEECRTSGARNFASVKVPALTGWANFCRASGAMSLADSLEVGEEAQDAGLKTGATDPREEEAGLGDSPWGTIYRAPTGEPA